VSAARPTVVIIGAGGLARALSQALARSREVRVAIASRRPAAAAQVARGVRGVRAFSRIDDAVAAASIVVLAVPDRAIAPLAKALAPMRPSWRGVVVLHAAGAYGPELLAPLRDRSASTGVFHPLAVLGARGNATLRGAYARIEGMPAARAAARHLCSLLGLTPLRGQRLETPSGRSAYHAAASLASNDLVALLAAGQGLLVRRGVPAGEALSALAVLAEGALAQVRDAGLAGALTGPVARNDGATLSAQLRALATDDKAAADAHRALSLRLIDLAFEVGVLDLTAAHALRQRLRRGPVRAATV
jgi:predicted short-subunit dehydrogenase-like oxidoreductase (DUF2520 family)